MLEIKFRAKALFNGNIGSDKWIYGENVMLTKCGDTKTCRINGITCDYETLGQFTGEKDKKRTEEYPEGEEIYGGAVVEIQNTKNQIQKMRLSGVVIFSFGSFGIEIKRVDEWVGYSVGVEPLEVVWFLNLIGMKEVEVIG